MTRSPLLPFVAGFAACLAVVAALGAKPGQQPASPVEPIAARDVYYPGTEALRPDEMRVVALGTGMPTVRPKQAAASFLVELGNGEKFLFDVGYGSVGRLSAMKIPMDYLDKVFIGHLHMDHFGDLDALWIGGVKMNRTFPLRVWRPSMAYFVPISGVAPLGPQTRSGKVRFIFTPPIQRASRSPKWSMWRWPMKTLSR